MSEAIVLIYQIVQITWGFIFILFGVAFALFFIKSLLK